MAARWAAFGVWAVVAASALYWGLRLFVAAPAVPPHAVVAVAGASSGGDPARVLGGDEPATAAAEAPEAVEPEQAARFQLVGVVAPEGAPGAARGAGRSGAAQGPGVALIAIDGKPARAFRVGAIVDGETVLQSVQQRGAVLRAPGAQAPLALELPPLPPPATGVPASGAIGAAQVTPLRPPTRVPSRPLSVPPPGAMVPPPGAMAPPPTSPQAAQVEQDDLDSVQAPGGEARR